jgi:hypothetical protein
MTLTKEQHDQMLEAAKSLMQWLNNNCHPHCKLLVDQDTVELVESVAMNKTSKFLKD